MPVPVPTLAFDIPNGKFVITDTTNWTGVGISTSNVNDWFSITGSATGLIYAGSTSPYDIIVASTTVNRLISLPVDGSGKVVQQTYTLSFNSVVTGGTTPGTYNTVLAANYNYVQPTITISPTVNCLCSSLSVTATNTFTNGAVTSYTNTITYPIDPNTQQPYAAPAVTTTALNAISPIAVGTFGVNITADVTFTFTNYSVIDVITSNLQIPVTCTNICQFYCAYEQLLTRYDNATPGTQPWQTLQNQVIQAIYLLNMYNFALNCGKSNDLQGYATAMVVLFGECGCPCTDCADPTGWIPSVCTSSGSGGITYTATTPVQINGTVISLLPSFVATVNKINSASFTATGTFNSLVTYPQPVTATQTTLLQPVLTLNNEEAHVVMGSGSGGINQLGITVTGGDKTGSVTAGATVPHFWRDIRGYVNMNGYINGLTAYSGLASQWVAYPIITLPVGYRPLLQTEIPVTCYDNSGSAHTAKQGSILILANGSVLLVMQSGQQTGNMIAFLNSVSFKAEQ